MKQACAVAALIGLLVVSLVAPSPAGAQHKKKKGRPVTCIETPAGAFIHTPGTIAGPLPQGCPPGLGNVGLMEEARNADIFCVVGSDVASLTFQLGDNTTMDAGTTNTVTTVLSQVNTVIPCGEIPDRRGGRLRHGAAGHYRHGHGAGFSIHRLERPIPLSIFRKCFLRSPGRG